MSLRTAALIAIVGLAISLLAELDSLRQFVMETIATSGLYLDLRRSGPLWKTVLTGCNVLGTMALLIFLIIFHAKQRDAPRGA